MYRAFFSTSVMDFIDFKSLREKKFYLFDTFQGIIKEQVGKGEKAAYKNEYPDDTYEFILNSFKEYNNVVVTRGVVPESLTDVKIDKVAFLSLDMNILLPNRAAMEHFWPKMTRGGIMIINDYAFPDRDIQQKNADEFADNVGVKILTMPTGQGIIIKP
ncbi:MAG: hypothetical protein JKX73_04140 [Flavobacteriales bacterium]|nr:hypothetical protein [Flavobacteriales bacterium]